MITIPVKKILLILTFCLIGVFAVPPVFATEKINSFESKITIQKDATVLVSETIVYDFGTAEKHGIFRDIPVIYENEEGEKFKIDFQVLSIKDENGISYQYKQSKKGEDVSIRIGDSDKYVTGEKTYVIVYKVSRVITYFSDHDELYWNVTGNNWQVPIVSAQALVTLPEENLETVNVVCYTGQLGSKENKCLSRLQVSNQIFFSNTEPLS